MANRSQVNRESHVNPEEVLLLQRESGSTDWGLDTKDHWASCIDQALCVATARGPDNVLWGVGFLVGNIRHSQVVDLTVHPDAQREGLGNRIVTELLAFATEQSIRYVGLVRDPSKPWLKEFYEQLGFYDIDFAMTYEMRLTPPSVD